MANARIPQDVMLFTSILFREEKAKDQAIAALLSHYGKTAYSSLIMPFAYTSYYEKELGSPIYRIILAFDNLVPRDALPEIKSWTNEIENNLMDNDKRTVNIDPGILSLENICLATAKPYSHRIYLRNGIWAEITLIYKANSYYKLEWTYPDYASDDLLNIFNHLRTIYKEKIKCHEA